MEKRKTIVNKVKHLLKKSGLPTYLHNKGPKKFCFWELCLGLLVKEVYRLSYRRAAIFLDEFYGIELHWTTLQKCRKRIPLSVWQKLLQITTDKSVSVPISIFANRKLSIFESVVKYLKDKKIIEDEFNGRLKKLKEEYSAILNEKNKIKN